MNTTFTAITGTEYIGNTLESINLNLKTVDTYTFYLNQSSANIFNPLREFYLDRKDSYKSMIRTVQDNAYKWRDLTSVVSTNSSRWIKPLVYFHPTIMEDSGYVAPINSFKLKYPVTLQDGKPFFVENQKAIVYYFVRGYGQEIQEHVVTKSDSITCQTQDITMTLWCTNLTQRDEIECANPANKGTTHMVNCLSVMGYTCPSIHTLECSYREGGKTSKRWAEARINGYFKDLYEKELIGVLMEVVDCAWVFRRYI
jgi:hypothetical protein